MVTKLPSWIKVKGFNHKKYQKTLDTLTNLDLNTVCIEANCPNRYECFSRDTATFMILGKICTRNCLYCNVKKGKPKTVDKDESKRIAKAVKSLKLKYVTITCVTRDDLEDCGALQFVNVVKAIRKFNQGCKIELLISDLNGNLGSLNNIIDIKPDVINHNIEIVKELFSELRPKANYARSLNILSKAKESGIKTKSGLMVGFGETKEEIIKTIRDVKKTGCDILTIGQYLQPNQNCVKVRKYYKPEEFNDLKEKALKLGFKHVLSGPLVRSSYKAGCY